MPNLSFENANALYIHIPFCSNKCPYCDFYSIKYTKKRVDQYWAALFMELEDIYQNTKNNLLQTIYIGGGTPSLIEPEMIEFLIKKIKSKFKLIPDAEITIEVNPASINEEKIIALKRAGVNRLSVGVQSFNDEHLSFLGRKSTAEINKNTLNLVKRYFNNYSADLIFALPGQSLEEFKQDLIQMLKFKPPHISLYNLEIHENTYFYKKYEAGDLNLPAEEIDAEMYSSAREILLKNDYLHYEISNFARWGYRARHNYIYWLYQSYIALGPGASGFDGLNRYQNLRDLNQYISYYNPDKESFLKTESEERLQEKLLNIAKNNMQIRTVDSLSKKEQMAEYCFLALRTSQGIFYHKFYQKFGVDFSSKYKKVILELLDKKLVVEENNHLYLSEKGKELANEVFIKFLP